MKYIGEQAGISRIPHYSSSKHGVGLYANYAGMLTAEIVMRFDDLRVYKYLRETVTANNTIGHDVPIEAIFGDNIARLKEQKKKYDPQNTFRHWHNLNAPLEASE